MCLVLVGFKNIRFCNWCVLFLVDFTLDKVRLDVAHLGETGCSSFE